MRELTIIIMIFIPLITSIVSMLFIELEATYTIEQTIKIAVLKNSPTVVIYSQIRKKCVPEIKKNHSTLCAHMQQ